MFLFRIELCGAFRADAVTELHLSMVPDVVFDLVPVALVVADFLARCTDGQDSSESIQLAHGLSQEECSFPFETLFEAVFAR